MRIPIVAASLVLLGLTASCTEKDDLRTTMSRFKTQMCACSDRQCTERVKKTYGGWKRKARQGVKPSEHVLNNLQADEFVILQCQRRIADADPSAPILEREP